MIKKIVFLWMMVGASLSVFAQRMLTIDECRQMAIDNNKDIEQARTRVQMADYDRKIALANYFPNISATGIYMYNNKDLSLLTKEQSDQLTHLGTHTQAQLQQIEQSVLQQWMSNPLLAAFLATPAGQSLINSISQLDVSHFLNHIGNEINDAFTIDIQNIFSAAVTLQQPIFVGGKIVVANQMAKMAADLARTQYDLKYQETVVAADQAYWQVVSVAAKKRLAESYDTLLHQMSSDMDVAVKEGVATEADALSIKVKVNEADMLLTKATNGLSLSKMLLCRLIGLDLNTQIVLQDELSDTLPQPLFDTTKNMTAIYESRPEMKSLELASKIYHKKIAMARADMMPKVLLAAGYWLTNPSLQHGLEKNWSGMFSVGVVLQVPIIHGCEALYKTKKAKAEETLYQSQYEQAKGLIELQVAQLRKQQNEAFEKLIMTESDLKSAEENLRAATIGFNAGVIPANTVLAAQTAWLKAHSENIDAAVEVQMIAVNLRKAEGNY